jgi:hypothetical protein
VTLCEAGELSRLSGRERVVMEALGAEKWASHGP